VLWEKDKPSVSLTDESDMLLIAGGEEILLIFESC
jgi:hypothetical protein